MSLTYGDFKIGRKIQNTQNHEFAEITALGNGLVELTITSGPDEGKEIPMSPEEVQTLWTGIA